MAAQYKHEAIETQRPLDIEKRSDSDDERPLAKAGTNQDDLDMDRLGKKQQLSRNFRSFSILGLTCVVMGTWLGMITASSFSLINGGRAGTIWVYVAVWFCSLAVVASMAEMASMAPTSGGQYHWVSVRFSEVHVFQSQPETSANNYTFLLTGICASKRSEVPKLPFRVAISAGLAGLCRGGCVSSWCDDTGTGFRQ